MSCCLLQPPQAVVAWASASGGQSANSAGPHLAERPDQPMVGVAPAGQELSKTRVGFRVSSFHDKGSYPATSLRACADDSGRPIRVDESRFDGRQAAYVVRVVADLLPLRARLHVRLGHSCVPVPPALCLANVVVDADCWCGTWCGFDDIDSGNGSSSPLWRCRWRGRGTPDLDNLAVQPTRSGRWASALGRRLWETRRPLWVEPCRAATSVDGQVCCA